MNNRLKIAIGPVEGLSGGVSQHILNIKKYSSDSISIIPSDLTRRFLSFAKNPAKVMGVVPINWYSSIFKCLTLKRFDVVHSHATPWMIDLARISRSESCKWIHTYHMIYFEEDFQDSLKDWQIKVNDYLLKEAVGADVKLSVSKWLQRYLLDEHDIETTYIPNGYDSSLCDDSDGQRFKKRYGVSDFILYAGGSNPRKNPGMYVKLASKMKDHNFVMIGWGNTRKELSKKFGPKLPSNLHMLGELPYLDVLDAVAACKVYVMTTRREGLPTGLLEAMGLGRPSVVPRVPGCEEVINNGVSGFFYEPNSIESLVEMTYKALDSRNVGINAKEVATKKYSWNSVINQINRIYSEPLK